MKSSKQDALKHIGLNQGNWHIFNIHNGLERTVSAREVKDIETLLKQAQTGNKAVRIVVLEMS